MYHHVIQKVVPFVLTFAISVLLAGLLVTREQTAPEPLRMHVGSGSGYGSGTGAVYSSRSTEHLAPNAPLRITSKPRPRYTDEARANGVEGTVRLKVTLLAGGTVGSIIPVTELPDGLTEMAIAAARKIEFEPKMVDGRPMSVTVTVEYSFTIY